MAFTEKDLEFYNKELSIVQKRNKHISILMDVEKENSDWLKRKKRRNPKKSFYEQIEVKAPPVFVLGSFQDVREVILKLIEQEKFVISSRARREGVNENTISRSWKRFFGTNINPRAVMAAFPTERIIKRLLKKREITNVKQQFVVQGRNFLQYVVEATDDEGNSIDPLLENRVVLGMERIFRVLMNGKRVVEHNYFGLIDEFEDSNFGKEILARNLRLYQRTRIRTIGLRAQGFGSYAWARYGFEIQDDIFQKFMHLKSVLSDRLFEAGADKADILTLVPKIKTMHEIASVTFNGRRIGKEVLIGESWDGFLNLTNKRQLALLMSYVNSTER